MGVLADLKAQAKTFGATSPLRSWIDSQLTIHDLPAPSSATAKDANHTVRLYDSNPTGGTFTLKVGVRQPDGSVQSATTAGIAYNASGPTIEAAIDTALGGVVTGWTNSDITVSGGALTTSSAVLIFDGDSVSGREAVTTEIDGSGLTGGSLKDPPVLINTPGQTNRPALSTLIAYGVIDSTTTPLQSAPASENAYANIFTKVRVKRIPGLTGGNLKMRIFVPLFGYVESAQYGHSASGIFQINQALDNAGIPGYVSGDIDIGYTSGAGIINSSFLATYKGASVQRGLVLPPEIVDVSLVPTPDPLQLIGVVDQTFRTARAIPANIIKLIMREVAAEDANNGSYYSLQSTLYPQDRSPLTESRIESDHLPSNE